MPRPEAQHTTPDPADAEQPDSALTRAVAALAEAAGFDAQAAARVRVSGEPVLGGRYPVGTFAAAAIATTALATAELTGHDGPVRVDAPLANGWFRAAVRPRPEQPSPWDPLTGDYRTADGWIRLHLNAPHHRAAALRVLGLAPAADGPDLAADAPGPTGDAPGPTADAPGPTRDEVARAVAPFDADALETLVVEAGGAAARLRSVAAWAQHPQGVAVASEPLIAVETTGDVRAADAPFPAGTPERPLAGVRVLDLTRVLAGPVATRSLALLGADVLRIDPPDWHEPAVEPDMTLGKRCARVDAHTVEGRSELLALVAECDVLVHGYRPGALDGLGLDPATLRSVRPGLVEVQLDAWGYSGPWAGRRGFDSLVQLATGIASPDAADGDDAGDAPRASDAPIALPVQALDHATGWFAATAALRAVARARRTGEGSRSRVSLARTALELERLSGLLGPAPARDEPRLPSAPLDTPWGVADVLEPPYSAGSARLGTVHPPRHLGSDEPFWLVDDRADEAETERLRPRGPQPGVMLPARALAWALVSAALVWAAQGGFEVVGAAVLGRPDIGAGWWSRPAWAAGAALQAVALLLGWMLASRRLTVAPALAVAIGSGHVANLVGVTVATSLVGASLGVGPSAQQVLQTGLGLGVIAWVTGAALVQLATPVLVALLPPFLGRVSGRARAVEPRYARRGRRAR